MGTRALVVAELEEGALEPQTDRGEEARRTKAGVVTVSCTLQVQIQKFLGLGLDSGPGPHELTVKRQWAQAAGRWGQHLASL